MEHLLSVGLVAMHQDMQRLDSIAGNLANVSTPAYKREIVAARPFADAIDGVVMEGLVSASGPDGNGARMSAAGLMVMLDHRPGTLKSTGQPLDIAITGDGFFEVLTEGGPAYTRQGNFHLDARGRLVTAQGDPVMGKGGEIFLTTPTPSIDQAGNITEPQATSGPSLGGVGVPIGQLKLVRFDKVSEMQRLGGGLLSASAGGQPLNDADVSLRQGALENANVNSMQEMVQLIQTMRHFESIQKIVQGYDEMVGTAVRKLGDLS